MKRIIAAVILCLFMIPKVMAYMPEMVILEKKDIAKLSDEQLVDTYMDLLVEVEASKAFHYTSGFVPKEYKAYKDLLKYRMLLIMEIHTRNIELPQLERFGGGY